MGQEKNGSVKNPLRPQSKYGLMGSSAKIGKKIFEGHRSTFWIKMPFGIGHPPPTHQLQSTCMGRAQGSQIFKRNSIISIHSKVMAFLVILLSPRGPHRPPVIPMSSPSSPHHLHDGGTMGTMSGPCRDDVGMTGTTCGDHRLHMLSPSSPHRPRRPHVVPVIPTLSPHRPHDGGMMGTMWG